jgi:hypothetical protein
LAGLGASGCLDFSDNRGAIMSVELCWDEQPGAGFVGRNCTNSSSDKGTCDRAGVDTMVWTLTNAGTGAKVANRSEPCANGIDVVDPAPGRYTLSVTGMDKDQTITWKATCKGLDLLRFDIGYECDVDAP